MTNEKQFGTTSSDRKSQADSNSREPHNLAGIFSHDYVQSTLKHYEHNNLYQVLSRKVGHDRAEEVLRKYNIGTCRNGDSVVWLSNSDNPFDGYLDGLIFSVDPHLGTITSKSPERVTERLGDLHGIELPQLPLNCFIGQSLVRPDTDSHIVVVSEIIDALLGSFFPNMLWLAIHPYLNLDDHSLFRPLPSEHPIILLASFQDEDKWHALANRLQQHFPGEKERITARNACDYTQGAIPLGPILMDEEWIYL